MSDEDWVKAAMADDTVVVNLLVRLNQVSPPKTDSPAFPFDWSVRQRRSKPVMLQAAKKLTARASPTTPLSWSGATSHSGGGAVDGFEESSPPTLKPSDISRSKGTGTSEAATTKRSKKKKTLSELKEEEALLLKERRHLKRELSTLHSTMEKQRAANESLKRMKLDLQSRPQAKGVATVESKERISDPSLQNSTASEAIPPILPKTSPLLDPKKELTDHETKITLPDLNVPLEEDDPSFEALNEMS
ncbi:hypothetical protein LguiA_028512 [Lonicera macranthoides]